MSTYLGTNNRLLTAASGILLSFGGTVTAPVVLPTPPEPSITAENDEAQTITFSLSNGLSYDQVRYEVAGAGPYTPGSFTIQLSPTISYLPGAVVLYVVGIEGVRNESQRVSNQTTLAAYVPPANTTPTAPSLAGNDTNDTLTITSAYALGELEMRTTDNQTVRPLPALVLDQGDVDRLAGYTQVRVRANTGRNASAWANSPAFTKKPVASGLPDQTYTMARFDVMQTAPGAGQWKDADGRAIQMQLIGPEPTYLPTDLNGKPCLRFEGQTGYKYSLPPMPAPGQPQAFTYLIGLRYTSSAASLCVEYGENWNDGGGLADQVRFGFYRDGNIYYCAVSPPSNDHTRPGRPGEHQVLCHQLDLIAKTSRFSENGGTPHVRALSSYQFAQGLDLYVACRAGNSFLMQGDVTFVHFFKGVVPDALVQEWITYYRQKFS